MSVWCDADVGTIVTIDMVTLPGKESTVALLLERKIVFVSFVVTS